MLPEAVEDAVVQSAPGGKLRSKIDRVEPDSALALAVCHRNKDGLVHPIDRSLQFSGGAAVAILELRHLLLAEIEGLRLLQDLRDRHGRSGARPRAVQRLGAGHGERQGVLLLAPRRTAPFDQLCEIIETHGARARRPPLSQVDDSEGRRPVLDGATVGWPQNRSISRTSESLGDGPLHGLHDLIGAELLALLGDEQVQIRLRFEAVTTADVVQVQELLTQVDEGGRDDVAIELPAPRDLLPARMSTSRARLLD